MSNINNSPSVGIMTFYRTGNYGGVLQAYALKGAITDLGLGDAEIIPYRADAIKGKINLGFIKKAGLFRTVVALFEKLYYWPRIAKVNHFVDSFAASEEIGKRDLHKLNDSYDIFLSGSDQIWNPSLQQGDSSYLLDFVFDDSKKRSYGSSFGVSELPANYKGTYRSLLCRYETITVREESGADIVQELTGKRPEIVLDPTLLLPVERWEEIAQCAPSVKRNRLFVYQLGSSGKLADCARRYRDQTGNGVDFVPFPIGGIVRCRPHLNLSPQEWLGAIRDASFVLADSFHAIVFAILFHTDFYYVVSSDTVEKRIGRITTLLSALGLSSRVVRNASECDFRDSIVWNEVDSKLSALRGGSLEKLRMLLKPASSESGEDKGNPVSRPLYCLEKRVDAPFFDGACTGCGACELICPVGAITMLPDEQGFLRPHISEKCINCGRCTRTCPVNSKTLGNAPRKCFIVSRPLKPTEGIRSAGVCTELARYALKRHDIVYGVALDEGQTARHVRVKDVSQLGELSGSKYVQSNKGETFSAVKDDLTQGKRVLFFGTPCEIAGLVGSLGASGINMDNLLTVDLICHGVPSPLAWEENLKKIHSDHHIKKLANAEFRDSSFGRVAHIESYADSSGNKIFFDNEYTALFYAGLILRPSCTECRFSTTKRQGDITVGDYWGVSPAISSSEKIGVNTLFLNSFAAVKAWQAISEHFDIHEATLDECMQPNLEHPTARAEKAEEFWSDFRGQGWSYCVKKYYPPTDRLKLIYRKIRRRFGV